MFVDKTEFRPFKGLFSSDFCPSCSFQCRSFFDQSARWWRQFRVSALRSTCDRFTRLPTAPLCRGVLRNNSPPAAGGGRWHCVWGKGSGKRRSSPSSPGRPQDRGVGQRVPQGRPLWPRHPSCVVFARPEEPAALPALGIVPGRRPWEAALGAARLDGEGAGEGARGSWDPAADRHVSLDFRSERPQEESH